MASLTYKQLLVQNRSFRRLWVGQVISELGNWFNFLAALGLVRLVANADPVPTTLILIFRLVPFTVFAPLAGAFVDRWSRRTVMIVTDLLRVAVAIGFLFVRRQEDLWIAYLCTALLSVFGAFFEAAKNASVPNITGEQNLLAGNALMFSSRFLLMSVGAALGGWTAAHIGYKAAFIINAVSFIASAYSIWLIPDKETRQESAQVQNPERSDGMDPRTTTEISKPLEASGRSAPGSVQEETRSGRTSYWQDIREGWSYIINNRPVAAILGANILWATGGGAMNLIAERLGALVFGGPVRVDQDSAVAALYFAGGLGLFGGMVIARRVGTYVEVKRKTINFIGWGLIIQGVVFALVGVMPGLWIACVVLFVARALLGLEFAVQETLLMRLVPDKLRGRVSTTDRACEMLVWSVSTGVSGWSLSYIGPRTLTVVTGLLSGVAGIAWLIAFGIGWARLPRRFNGGSA